MAAYFFSPPQAVLRVTVGVVLGIYIGIMFAGVFHRDVVPSGSKNNPTDGTDMAQRLSELRAEIQQWKTKAETTKKEYTETTNKINKLQNSFSDCPQQDQSSRNRNNHPLCRELGFPTPSAFSLWNHNILDILKATRLPNDEKYKFHDFTTQVLQIITPRLPRSVKSVPFEWGPLERAMTVGWERYKYMQLTPQERATVQNIPRRLKILVMGGSLLVGTNCRKLLSELNLGFRLPKRDCNWANRLGKFFDLYLGEDIIEVDKVAMGGTNTATGNVIFQYDLIPTEVQNPDIVINAYSTNDMHILTVLEAQSSNTTLRDRVFEMTQDYVRSILQSCDEENRPPPLLLHVDDYLGNEQHKIWETTELAQGVQVLASYYGFTSFSYADVVRDIVYGDTYESWLSANWWETGKFEREIHPGMGMHIASTWVTVYNLLNLVTTYCSMPSYSHPYNISEYEAGVLGLPPLHKDVAQAKGKPRPHPKGLPPVLTKDLLLEDVTALWKKSESELLKCSAQNDHGHHHQTKCPFSWVSGLSLQQNNETFINEYFRSRASKWTNWRLSKDGGKIGFIPAVATPREMILDFSFGQTIRSVTMFYMKSYGSKWANSEIQLSVRRGGGDVVLEERSLVGFHGKNTSEMYTEEIQLSEPLPANSKFQIQATQLHGKTFKIMGLAVCS